LKASLKGLDGLSLFGHYRWKPGSRSGRNKALPKETRWYIGRVRTCKRKYVMCCDLSIHIYKVDVYKPDKWTTMSLSRTYTYIQSRVRPCSETYSHTCHRCGIHVCLCSYFLGESPTCIRVHGWIHRRIQHSSSMYSDCRSMASICMRSAGFSDTDALFLCASAIIACLYIVRDLFLCVTPTIDL
jgi:hypothetical protein